ncbi:hypothetical protein [Candidatus Thiosymbion oneisti]|uniref:hypothetical protein n=1 Tax=Candidatus Thiosymbion oneisti TaxID=589554 RepID=UPI000B314E56|nr:hypothetical protein [Candidatus Thiosymbion oneisti]
MKREKAEKGTSIYSDNPNGPLQVLIIDPWFDPYVGVVSLLVMSTGRTHQADSIGVFTPKAASSA